jgi:hypothetical protein
VLEQEALHVDPAAEAGERTVGANHAMARQNDRKRVESVGRAHRPRCLAAETEAPGLLAVADRLSVRNGCKSAPAASVEVGSDQLCEPRRNRLRTVCGLTRGRALRSSC